VGLGIFRPARALAALASRVDSRRGCCLLALLVLVTTGCAPVTSGPTWDEMRAQTANFQLPMLPAPGQAVVYIVRPTYLGGLVRFNVFLDDQQAESEMGYTIGNRYIYFSVPAGPHTIYSSAGNMEAKAIDAKAGEIIYLRQIPRPGFPIARNSLEKMPDPEGKYAVKTLEVGTIIKTEK
jgi:hypothetical protein